MSVKIQGQFRIAVPDVTPKQLVELAGHGIHSLRERTAKARNVYDNASKPYSRRGPIYIPISGRGTITKPLNSENIGRGKVGETVSFDAKNKTITLRRTKGTLGGREVLTAKDLRKLKASGVVILKKGSRTPKGGGRLIVRDTGKSIKFANYAEYKRALGKSGLRDLELSGKMLNALTIVRSGPGFVEIGFTREEEHRKAQRNQSIDPWFGMSPKDGQFILGHATRMVYENLRNAG